MCIGSCTNQVTLRNARCNGKDTKIVFIKLFSWLWGQKNVHKFIIYKHEHTSALQISTYYHNFSPLELYTHTHTFHIKHNLKELQNTTNNTLNSFPSPIISLLVTTAVWISLLSVRLEHLNDNIYLLGEEKENGNFLRYYLLGVENWDVKKKQQQHLHWARIYLKENRKTTQPKHLGSVFRASFALV